MRSTVKKLTLAAAALLIVAIAAFPANNSEQVIFSGTGFGNFGSTETPFGFWVWCSAEPAGPSKGAYPGDHACQGAMYFYALGITKGVGSFPVAIPGVTEGPDGVYTMHLHSADGAISGCELTNVLPTLRGPKNTVHLECATPSGSGDSFPNAVVNVTGP